MSTKTYKLIELVGSSPETLFFSDGTEGGTHALAEVGSTNVAALMHDNLAYFTTDEGDYPTFWRTDCTSLGTFPLFEGTDWIAGGLDERSLPARLGVLLIDMRFRSS